MSEVAEAPGAIQEREAVTAGGLAFELTVGAIAWTVAALVFLLPRFAAVLSAPVGGPEAIHLSGAWQASLGTEDARFVPTLFQEVTALLFEMTASEVWPRVFAFAATATVPAAVWLLRPQLGNAGALTALLLLAVDPVGLWLGSSATAMGFDIALTAWLFVLLARGWPTAWLPAVAGLLVAVSGPLTVPLLAGWAAATFLRREPVDRVRLAFAGAGAIAGVAVASFGFWLGFDDLKVPPLDLFAKGFDQEWSTATAAELMLLYGWPLALGGVASAAFALSQGRREGPADRSRFILVGWLAFALAWWLAAANSQQALPVAAVTMASALLLGPVLPRAVLTMLNAEWRWARYLLPLAGVAALLALAIVADWAADGRTGDAREQLLAASWALIALAALGLLAWRPVSRPTVLSAALLAGALVVLPGTAGLAFHADPEPLPSPVSPGQARVLRNAALEIREDDGGSIVVHPDFADLITWPFRDSGKIVVASRVPLDASVVIWPAGEAKPDGFSAVEGEWSLRRSIEPPVSSWLDYLGWFIDRNSLDVRPDRVAVYSKAAP